MLHLVIAEHLLDQQERVGSNQHLGFAMRPRPFQGRNEAAIFRDIVRGDADRLVKLVYQRAIRPLDSHAETGRPRVAPGAAVRIRDDHDSIDSGGQGAAVAATGTKKRMRWQESHCRMSWLRRTLLNTCGRMRTWQIVQMPSRASATATPLRRLETSSKIERTCGDSDWTTSARSLVIWSSASRTPVRSVVYAFRSASTDFCSAAASASARLTAAVRSSASIIPSRILSS